MDIYRGDSIRLAVLSEGGRSRAVRDQFSHYLSGCVCRHSASGEEGSNGASAEWRRPAGTSRIWSTTAANSGLTRVTC